MDTNIVLKFKIVKPSGVSTEELVAKLANLFYPITRAFLHEMPRDFLADRAEVRILEVSPWVDCESNQNRVIHLMTEAAGMLGFEIVCGPERLVLDC